MEAELTPLEGVIIIKPDIYKDDRGFFTETYSKDKYYSLGIREEFVQDNYSRSKKNTLRGLHYQINKPQGKLVRVINGRVLDVAGDVRQDSKTFGQYFSVFLDDVNFYQLYMPPGIAHGFCVVSEFADFEYKCTNFYSPKNERGVLWSDSDININWPVANPIVSSKDLTFNQLKDIPKNELL